jgi:hypothetical protein
MPILENIYLDIADDGAFGHMRNVASVLAHVALSNRVLNGGEMPQSNEAFSLIASSAHTANEVTSQQVNIAAPGLTLFFNVTINGSAESLTLTIEGKDSVSGVWVQLDTSGVLTSSTGLFAWQPSVGLPRYWRGGVNKSGGASVTYSLSGQYCRDHPSDATITGSLPAGDNNIGNVDVVTLPSLPAGTNNIGDVDVLTLPALVAGTANIGDVDVLTLPALPAGTNNIGDVDVLTLPALVAGTANIGDVDIASIAAGDNNIGNVDIVTLPALVAGTANIGDVDVVSLPAATNAGATAKTLDYDTGAGTDTVTSFGVLLPKSGGAVAGGTSTDPIRTDPTGTTTQPVSGTVTANLAAGTNNIGDVDVLSIAAGDNNIGNVDIVTLPALVAGTANIGDVDIASGPTGASAIQLQGTAAVDAPAVGNPVRVGSSGQSADITPVTAADAVDNLLTILGKQVILPYALPGRTWSYAAAAGGLVNTTGVTVKAAGAGAERNYVTKVSIVNSHQTTSTEVVIRDGAAGTVLWRGWAQAAGGGQVEEFNPPLRGTAATLVEIAEITTTATAGCLVNLQGFVAAE